MADGTEPQGDGNGGGTPPKPSGGAGGTPPPQTPPTQPPPSGDVSGLLSALDKERDANKEAAKRIKELESQLGEGTNKLVTFENQFNELQKKLSTYEAKERRYNAVNEAVKNLEEGKAVDKEKVLAIVEKFQMTESFDNDVAELIKTMAVTRQTGTQTIKGQPPSGGATPPADNLAQLYTTNPDGFKAEIQRRESGARFFSKRK